MGEEVRGIPGSALFCARRHARGRSSCLHCDCGCPRFLAQLPPFPTGPLPSLFGAIVAPCAAFARNCRRTVSGGGQGKVGSKGVGHDRGTCRIGRRGGA